MIEIIVSIGIAIGWLNIAIQPEEPENPLMEYHWPEYEQIVQKNLKSELKCRK